MFKRFEEFVAERLEYRVALNHMPKLGDPIVPDAVRILKAAGAEHVKDRATFDRLTAHGNYFSASLSHCYRSAADFKARKADEGSVILRDCGSLMAVWDDGAGSGYVVLSDRIKEARDPELGKPTRQVHISTIRPGDTIVHNGMTKTVSGTDIRKGGMGTTIFGDSYNSGHKLVTLVDTAALESEGVDEGKDPKAVTSKDEMRISDILKKADGQGSKAVQLARQMANAIQDAFKALRRARAAERMGNHDLADIFFDRYAQLA